MTYDLEFGNPVLNGLNLSVCMKIFFWGVELRDIPFYSSSFQIGYIKINEKLEWDVH